MVNRIDTHLDLKAMPITYSEWLYIKCILLLILQVKLCFAQNHFPGLLKFDKVNFNETFVTLYKVKNLKLCQQNCIDRQRCGSLNYHTRYPYECVLNSEEGLDLVDSFGWVHQARSEIKMNTPCTNCNYNQTCDRSSRTCIYRECEPITSNDDYIRLGNRNTVGSKAVLACPNNMYPDLPHLPDIWPATGVCLENGQWSFPLRPKCAQFIEYVWLMFLVNPKTKAVSQKWSNFMEKTVTLVSGPYGVHDSMITTSSQFEPGYLPSMVKFDYPLSTDSWVPDDADTHPYVQVNFTHITEVRGVKIRGRALLPQYPTLFNITYSLQNCMEDVPESFVKNTTGGTTFMGNVNEIDVQSHMFEPPINALCVRVYILDFYSNLNHFGMKLDLYGTLKLPIL